MLGDWVAPYGKGKTKDFIFRRTVSKGDKEGEFEESISVKFSNAKDGLIPFESSLHKGSALASSYKAPKKGYASSWVQTNARVSGEPLKTNRKADRNFYFRIRTKLDSSGNIVSANYGKIYGDFMSFIYYVNPKVNDDNLEFDVQNNLFGNLNWKEEVNHP